MLIVFGGHQHKSWSAKIQYLRADANEPVATIVRRRCCHQTRDEAAESGIAFAVDPTRRRIVYRWQYRHERRW